MRTWVPEGTRSSAGKGGATSRSRFFRIRPPTPCGSHADWCGGSVPRPLGPRPHRSLPPTPLSALTWGPLSAHPSAPFIGPSASCRPLGPRIVIRQHIKLRINYENDLCSSSGQHMSRPNIFLSIVALLDPKISLTVVCIVFKCWQTIQSST